MSKTREIPEHLREMLNAIPEYSYGVTRIRVTLEDGSRFNDVFVAWGREIVKVGISQEIPFDASRIVSVERQ